MGTETEGFGVETTAATPPDGESRWTVTRDQLTEALSSLEAPLALPGGAERRAEVANALLGQLSAAQEGPGSDRARAGKAGSELTADRKRIDLALFGCTVCGEIHVPRLRVEGKPLAGRTWASAGDGHPYQPPMFGSGPLPHADAIRGIIWAVRREAAGGDPQ